MNKQLVMTLLASGALVGLSGCSEGDEATIVIDRRRQHILEIRPIAQHRHQHQAPSQSQMLSALTVRLRVRVGCAFFRVRYPQI